jgi:hypothetical protein
MKSKALTIIFLVGCAAAGSAQDARVTLVGQPEFHTCENALPPTPPTAPAPMAQHLTTKWQNECGGGQVSTKYLVVSISAQVGPIPANQNVVQVVNVSGARYRHNPQTNKCDRRVPYAYVIPEYFTQRPALDHHLSAECCEMKFVEDVDVQTAIMPLPANAAQPIPGWNAGRPYNDAPSKAAIINQLANVWTAHWGYNYVHDTCQRPPTTPSGAVHHLLYFLEYRNGPSGSIIYTSKP